MDDAELQGASAAQIFGRTLAVTLATAGAYWLAIELTRRYERFAAATLDSTLDELEQGAGAALTRARRWYRIRARARREAPYVVWEALQILDEEREHG